MLLPTNEIEQILTKYYIKDSQLCFQILAQTKDDKTYVIENCEHYSDYKTAFKRIEEELHSGTVVEVKQYLTDYSLLSAVA
jgi:hypothetical protein